jgi:hypothetical protein
VLPGFGQHTAQARSGRPDLLRALSERGAIIGLSARRGQILLRDHMDILMNNDCSPA